LTHWDSAFFVSSDSQGGGEDDAVAITRDDYTAAELKQVVARTHEGDAARPMLALAHAMDGIRTVKRRALRNRPQILRDWVHRYNGEGLAGLFDRVL
jgi:hypothetical protein